MEETFLIRNKCFRGQSWKVRKKRKGGKSGQKRRSVEHRVMRGEENVGREVMVDLESYILWKRARGRICGEELEQK